MGHILLRLEMDWNGDDRVVYERSGGTSYSDRENYLSSAIRGAIAAAEIPRRLALVADIIEFMVIAEDITEMEGYPSINAAEDAFCDAANSLRRAWTEHDSARDKEIAASRASQEQGQ